MKRKHTLTEHFKRRDGGTGFLVDFTSSTINYLKEKKKRSLYSLTTIQNFEVNAMFSKKSLLLTKGAVI